MKKVIQFNTQIHWLMVGVITVALSATLSPSASAQEAPAQENSVEVINGDNEPAEFVSIHVNEGAMREVLNAFALQANRNIVLAPEVTNDTVTIHLNNVQWDNALDVILKPYGYGYREVGNAIVIGELGQLKTLEAVEPLQSHLQTGLPRCRRCRWNYKGNAVPARVTQRHYSKRTERLERSRSKEPEKNPVKKRWFFGNESPR